MNKFLTVKTAVDRADPCGLLKCGAPDDEYDIESAKISDMISDTDSAERIAGIMAEVFPRALTPNFPPKRFMRRRGRYGAEYRINGIFRR